MANKPVRRIAAGSAPITDDLADMFCRFAAKAAQDSRMAADLLRAISDRRPLSLATRLMSKPQPGGAAFARPQQRRLWITERGRLYQFAQIIKQRDISGRPARPRPIVLRAIPVMRDSADTPPHPADRDPWRNPRLKADSVILQQTQRRSPHREPSGPIGPWTRPIRTSKRRLTAPFNMASNAGRRSRPLAPQIPASSLKRYGLSAQGFL